MNTVVLGAGAWGTALAALLARAGHSVTLWGHDAGRLAELRTIGRNERYLPGIVLPRELVYEPDMGRAIAGREVIIVAIPSRAFREMATRLAEFDGVIVSVTKGIEYHTGLTMCGIIAETVPRGRSAAMSGPTFALEVARGIPTAIVAASNDAGTAGVVQNLFHQPTFRVYSSTDLLGVELGGALKNVIAIAAGVCDGLGFGDNSKAALITRAVAEIRRLGTACRAQPETFNGLSGLGDLTVTCFSKLSRNRGFGERLGRGEKLADVLAEGSTLAEGYPTARSAFELARRLGVVTPVIDEVYRMLYEDKNVGRGVRDLMTRDSKAED